MVVDSARRRICQELGKPVASYKDVKHHKGNHNRVSGCDWESEKPIVVLKPGNFGGAKGL